MTDRPILQPGITAPEFILQPINREQEESVSCNSSEVTVLLFLGSEMTERTVSQLTEYQSRHKDYAAKKARLVAITDASSEEMKKIAAEKQIEFPIVASEKSREVASSYGVFVNEQSLTAVFVVDQEGLIRRVFEHDPEEGLPNPAMVLRAVNNLSNSPKPPLLRSDDWRLGSADAPIVLIEYGDYQCSHCKDLFSVVKELMPSYENKIQFIFRHFPMRHAHPFAVIAAQAAEAAGAQGKFWEMHHRLFDVFGIDNALEEENLKRYAQEIGLDMDKFSSDLKSPEMESAVMDEYREATRHKIKSPPTLFVNYILFDSSHTLENLRNKIDGLLACLN
ncbi:thioredoxin domain-containing protein [Desulfosporosinus sp. FKA]|uniref:thioredoxin domain-containing protein n=1 Tax=Desulfosporosinus sp. FKA TaxID=1969834 RepID=UPI000B49D593|nr:thioredoxin domain-containing protein [Desulfosporosinus sp. FKA]